MKQSTLNMMRRLKPLCMLVFAVFAACGPSASVDTISSNAVQSSQIYQQYRISGERETTVISAVFRVGGATGTTVELGAPSQISYNGAPMKLSLPQSFTNVRTKGTTYETAQKGFSESNKFDYINADGKTFSNSINLAPLEINAKSLTSIQLTQPSSIPLSRTIGADENLVVTVNDGFGEKVPNSEKSIYFNAERNAVIITPQYWAEKSPPAQTVVKMRVYKDASVSEGTALGGTIYAEFSTAPCNVNVSRAEKRVVNNNAANKTNSVNAANVVQATNANARAADNSNTSKAINKTPVSAADTLTNSVDSKPTNQK